MSILSAGTFFGALLAFPLGDKIGRKWGLISACVIFSLGVGLQLDVHWATFVVGRVIAGIGGMQKAYREQIFRAHVIFPQWALLVALFPCTSPSVPQKPSVG